MNCFIIFYTPCRHDKHTLSPSVMIVAKTEMHAFKMFVDELGDCYNETLDIREC